MVHISTLIFAIITANAGSTMAAPVRSDPLDTQTQKQTQKAANTVCLLQQHFSHQV